MDSVLAKLTEDGERCLVCGVCMAIQEVEPYVLLRRPQVLGAHSLECVGDAWVTNFHGVYGVGAERDTSSNFTKGWCLFVYRHWDATMVQGDRKSETCNPTTDHSHFEPLGL
jgi:hypothetical protein